MFKRFKVTGINENPKKPKRNLMKYLALGCVMALPAFALLKTGVLSMNKNVIASDVNVKYDIVANLDGGKFEMGTTPEFTKMDNGNWLYKYKPVPTATKLPVPVKDGYTFTGWTVSAKPDIQKEYSIPAWHKGNLNVKANWKSQSTTLMVGQTFNNTIKRMSGFTNVTEIRFIKGTPNQDGTDVSEAQDKSIMASIKGNTLTVESEGNIFANKNSARIFLGARFFGDRSFIESIDLSNFDTSHVTDMSYMFSGCNSLTSLKGLENFKTSNVTNMAYMFSECSKIAMLDVSNLSTSNVTDISHMFSMCNLITNINGLEKFDTLQVTNMENVFYACESLTSLNLSSWNTSNVTRTESMFSFCSGLRTIDLSNWNTNNFKVVAAMFNKCKNLEAIKGLNNFNTANMTHFSDMFRECVKLSGTITIANPIVSNQYGYNGMFTECSTDPNVKFIVNYTSSETKAVAQRMVNTKSVNSNVFLYEPPMTLMDGPTFNRTVKGISGFNNVRRVVFTQNMPSTSAVAVDRDGNKSIGAHINGDALIISSVSEIMANPNSSGMFKYFSGIKNIDFSNFNTINVTNMSNMFNNCLNLQNLNLDTFNTSNVRDMSNMFMGCSMMTDLSIKTWDISNVSLLNDMFLGCLELNTLDIGGINPSSATNMSSMFDSCRNLTALDLSGWNVEKVVDASYMFNDCENLRTLSLNNWNLIGLTNASRMFNNCNRLHTLNLNGFNMPKVANTSSMFRICSDLTGELVISNPNTTNYSDMFTGCSINYGSKFVVKYNNLSSKAKAKSMVATKSSNSHVELYEPPTILVKGREFNSKIKTLTDWRGPVKIIFKRNIPSNVTSYQNVDVSLDQNRSAIAYKNGDTIYVCADGEILANPDSRYMFNDYYSLTNLDLTNFNTENVINMNGMFFNCNKLVSLNLTNFNTKNTINMYEMFRNCSSLSSLDLSSFDTGKVTSMSNMFNFCPELRNIEFGNTFSMKSVTDTAKMFNECALLSSTLVIDGTDVTNYAGMFEYCSTDSNAKFIVKYVDDNTKAVAKQMVETKSVNSNVFLYEPPKPVTLIDGNSFNTKLKGMNGFGSVTEIHFKEGSPNVSGIDLGLDGVIKATISGNRLDIVSEGLILANPDSGNMFSDIGSSYGDNTVLERIVFDNFDTKNVTNMDNMFSSCSSLKYVDVSRFDVSKVTSMFYMFSYCTSLSALDLSAWDSSSVTDMSGMFNYCSVLTDLNLNGFKTGRATDMSSMFSGCSNLTQLDLSGFRTSNVVDMNNMFAYSGLISINLAGFDTSSVTDMNNMFIETKIKGVDLTSFDTSSVTDMGMMFAYCSDLVQLDLSGFNTINVNNMSYMFANSSNLRNLNLNGFRTDNVQTMEHMFTNCSSLIGEITIMNPYTLFENEWGELNIFNGCSTNIGSKFIVNYTAGCRELAQRMVAIKSPNSNVLLGVECGYSTQKNHNNSILNMFKMKLNIYNRLDKSDDSYVALSNSLESIQQNSDTSKLDSKSVKESLQSNKTVNITLNNGSMAMYPIQKIQIDSGKIGDLAKPDLNPKYAGQFSGYFYDKNCTIPVQPNDIITQDIELYAKW